LLERVAGLIAAGLLSAAAPRAAARDFWAFETGPVRPLALSADGNTLFAVDTPDNRLEIFDVSAAGLAHRASVAVGLEPCAVAVRSASEVWVVNHLSDSVSVVDLSGTPRVRRTLLVGDEPRDIVFAGPDGARAFITTAARGQNHPSPADPLAPGIGRASVFVFDAAEPDDPPEVLTLFGDTPRALAVSPDRSKVYAAVFHSGNQTSALGVPASAGLPSLPPTANTAGSAAPAVGRIVRFDGSVWRDALGNEMPAGRVPFTLPDQDVFEIDANADPVTASGVAHAQVGSVIFNMAVNPQSGALYVSNTDANNLDRFEGSSAAWGSLRGELQRARITLIDANGVAPRHLNKHLAALANYAAEDAPGASASSLATPTDMAVSSDGSTLYVAAFGSRKLGIFSTAELADDSFVPDAADHVELGEGGPGGLALDEGRARLYVWTRFDPGIAIVDLLERREIARVALPDPEPAVLRNGRPFLYDARGTSSNGEASCSACHVFGDLDGLGWDLGDPDGVVTTNSNPFEVGSGASFHPLKGPMTTQTLRGLANHGPMHWRGDRSGATPGNPAGAFDERAAFEAFNVAFAGLLGRSGPLPAADMTAFARFALEIVSPPNPLRELDNSLSASAVNGETIYHGPVTDLVRNCNGCHALDASRGFFGSDGDMSIEGEPQEFKIPQLRNLVAKVGRFDVAGPQIRGFGYLHDGSIDTVLNFLRAPVFLFPGFDEAQRDLARRDVVAFLLRFPGELAPVVGQQVTLDPTSSAEVGARIDLLIARAETAFVLAGEPDARECDLVVKSGARGWAYDPANRLFVPDASAEPPLEDAVLRALAAAGQELTYTCAPPGSGTRIGIDRDRDGERDADDNCPALAAAGQTDADGDGRGAGCDNCPGIANPAQLDRGGWGAASLSDGLGDPCQCGDATDDGIVTQADVDQVREFLAGAGALTSADKCNLVGAAGGGEAACDLADSVAQRRHLAGEPLAGALDACGAAPL
jgi:DNA-binding beta-propeller fold protein YncE/mono/diheme cytochrome c family protein